MHSSALVVWEKAVGEVVRGSNTTETTGGQIDYGFDFKNRGSHGGYGGSICSPKGKESDPNTFSPGFRQLAGFPATPKLEMARLGTARAHAATKTTRPGPADCAAGGPWSLPATPVVWPQTVAPWPRTGMARERAYRASPHACMHGHPNDLRCGFCIAGHSETC